MRGSGGSNNLYYIKPGKFNDVYLKLLREFFINKYKTSSDIQEYLSLKTSTFSENKSKLLNALETDAPSKKGAPVNIIQLSENTKEPNPFDRLYYRCIDDSSIYFLNIMLVYHLSQLTGENIEKIIDGSTVDRFNSIKSNIEGLLKMNGPTANCKRIYTGCKEVCRGGENCPIADLARISTTINNKDGLYINDISEFLGKLGKVYQSNDQNYFSFNDTDMNTKIDKMERLVDLEILHKANKKYHISDRVLSKLSFSKTERFKLFLSFFSEYHPFGSVGNRLLYRLDKDYRQKVFRYNDRFIFNSINEYNLINILFAIKNKKALRIEYIKADQTKYSMIVLPLEVRQSTSDGRQYLVFYSPDERSVSGLRLEYIDKIEVGSLNVSTEIDKDLENASKLIAFCWSSGFDGYQEGNCVDGEDLPLDDVEVTFIIPEDKEYIKEYIKREIRVRDYQFTDVGNSRYTLSCKVTHFMDMIPWLNTLPEYITEIRYQKLGKKGGAMKQKIKYSFSGGGRLPSDEMLFCPENSISYMELIRLYSDTFVNGRSEREENERTIRELSKYKKGKIFDDYYNELMDYFDRLDWLMERSPYSNLIDRMPIDFPLTALEANWLYEASRDELARLFLNDDELADIQRLCGTGVNLYSLKDIVCFDRIDSNAHVDPDIFRTISDAINGNKEIRIKYKKPSVGNMVFLPESVYFSSHEYTFKLNCLGENDSYYVLRLDFILEVSIVKNSTCDIEEVHNKISALTEYETLKIGMFETTKNITDRFFRDISAYSVECVKNRLYESDAEAVKTVKKLLQNETLRDAKSYTYDRVQDIYRSDDGSIYIDLLSPNGEKTLKASEMDIESVEKTPNTLTRVSDHDDSWFEYVVTIKYPKASEPYLLKKILAYGNELFIINHDKGQKNNIIDNVASFSGNARD